ncbi:MAG: glutathione-disulfide reductase [Pseudomonadales bacterium]|nr:glutathione-disulfide reductase [Pseudomonadales bacterium]
MHYDYDLFVIGAGSGGVRASRMSASYGARVAVAESTYLGGTCVNVGCVPKKLFVYGSHFAEEFEDARGFGWNTERPGFDWPRLRDNKTREIERLNGIYENLLTGAGVHIKRGRAELVDAERVRVDDQVFTTRNILIATGSWPMVPDIPGRELAITSNEAFYLERFPERVVIVGGGYIAVEFAGIFAGLGARTTLVYRGPLFLRGFDDEVRAFVAQELRKKHIDLRFSTEVDAIETHDGARRVRLGDGEHVDTDLVLYATGRLPNTAGLGLEQAGVALNARGGVVVDDFYRSSVPNIHAIGDVIDRHQLTPVAIAEGMCIANNLFTDNPPRKVDYGLIPTAVFCQPNIGTVGLTEAEARARFGDVDVYATEFRPMKHTLSGRDERTFMKLLVNPADQKVVGAHMVGPEAGEIIQGIGVALTAGATKADFDRTIGIHPTAAEEFVTMRQPRAQS